MKEKAKAVPTLLRRRQVEQRTGLKVSAIYEGMRDGTFPASIKLGPRSVGWIDTEIDEWIRNRIAKSRGGKS